MKAKTIVLTELQHREIEENSKTKLQSFQRKIYQKAKQNPKYKFYCLYDKVFRKDILEESYRRVKKSHGTGGIDKVKFEDLEGKEDEFIEEIQEELKRRTYRPTQLKRVMIPKKEGKFRPLRIPTIKDRVVQMALKIVIEPIFESGFKECSYGYRPKKSAQQAIGKLQKELFREIYKKEEERKTVESIDLSNCFETIPHKYLMRIIAQRIIDREMLKLIKRILKAKAMGEDTKEDKDSGTPQGGVISPLLANIYLNKLEEYWEEKGNQSTMVRYADDCVIILNKKEEESYKEFLDHIENELKLKVNREKTKTENIKEGVEYLGFCLKEKTSRNKKQYLSVEPSKTSMKGIRRKIKEATKSQTGESNEEVVMTVNRKLKGWQQYFDNIAMGKTRNQIRTYAEKRVAKLISKRNKKSEICWKIFEGGKLYTECGLYKMTNMERKFC